MPLLWELGYLLGLVLSSWRMVVIGRYLPWAQWGRRYCRQPWWMQSAAWLLLITVYYFATWPPLILLCWLAALILLWWQPQVGLWLAAALLPFYAYHKEFVLGNLAFAVAPSHILLIGLSIVVFRQNSLHRGRDQRLIDQRHTDQRRIDERGDQSPEPLDTIRDQALRTGPAGPALLALSWLTINLLSAVNGRQWSAYMAGLWDLVLLPLLGFWLVRRLVRTPRQVTQLVLALFAGGVAIALGGVVGWLGGNGTAVDGVLRLVGPYFSANQAALYLERSLLLGLGLAWWRPRHWRSLMVACGVVALALLLTASRGALLLGLPVGLTLLGWGYKRRYGRPNAQAWLPWRLRAGHRNAVFISRPQARLLLGGLLGLITFALVLPLGDRLTNSVTVAQRLTIWQSSFMLWRDFFWLGVGPSGFFWRYPVYLPLGALNEPNLHHPHNLWLEFATGWGLLGLLWLGALLWWLGQRLWQLYDCTKRADAPRDWDTLTLLAALGAGLAHGQVDAFYVLPDLALWTWLVLALCQRQAALAAMPPAEFLPTPNP
ncbi:MAG: O-antigen ligase family protein [Caldilineaceae bacterium]